MTRNVVGYCLPLWKLPQVWEIHTYSLWCPRHVLYSGALSEWIIEMLKTNTFVINTVLCLWRFFPFFIQEHSLTVWEHALLILCSNFVTLSLKTLPLHFDSPCLNLGFHSFCLHHVTALKYIVACTDCLNSCLSPSPYSQAVSVHSWNMCSQISLKPLHTGCVTNKWHENMKCLDAKCSDQISSHRLWNEFATETGKQIYEKVSTAHSEEGEKTKS